MLNVARLRAQPLAWLTVSSALLLIFVGMRHFATGPMAVATVSYLLMVFGIISRRNDIRLHWTFMSTAIVMDLTLVLVLQFQRDAVQTAMAFTLSPIQQAHIFCSTLASILYIPMVVMGIALLKKPHLRGRLLKAHRSVGFTTFIFRTLGFLLMFSMIKSGTGH